MTTKVTIDAHAGLPVKVEAHDHFPGELEATIHLLGIVPPNEVRDFYVFDTRVLVISEMPREPEVSKDA